MTSTPPAAPSGPPAPRRTLTSRTTLVTAAAIAGVLIAGTAAVAANIGILNAADDSTLGELAATDELLPSEPASLPTTVATVATTAPSSTAPETTLPTGVAQQYDIEGAGSVWLMTTTSGLALDHVEAVPGWSPLLSQGDLRSLRVDFTNGDRTIVFTASLGADGIVVVDVTEPSTVFAQAPAAGATQNPVGASPTSGGYDDDHDDDEHDEYDEYDEYDDEYEDDDHDEYEYEDDHEYEGADDDD
ncbi:MAG TPA: hypothetical protein VMW33_13885 [Ilumatobacteraceae bacterium]|nr:hypothetical protein [Ilumatobacteraceae bacterium]